MSALDRGAGEPAFAIVPAWGRLGPASRSVAEQLGLSR